MLSALIIIIPATRHCQKVSPIQAITHTQACSATLANNLQNIKGPSLSSLQKQLALHQNF